MVHGVFALMNICQIAVLFAMRLPVQIMSADGLRSFALMNICQIVVLFYALATAPVMSADGS
jgi:N6-adenosine-specific RNA methylase IME4